MESLKGRVTNDTYKMLESLISLKEKINVLSKEKFYYLLLSIGSVGTLIFVIIHFIRIHTSENILFVASDFFGDFYRIMLIVISVALFLKSANYKKKIDEANADLEGLRLESIAHMKNSWHINDHSQLRDEISEIMEEYGINVRYKFNKKIQVSPASSPPDEQPASSD